MERRIISILLSLLLINLLTNDVEGKIPKKYKGEDRSLYCDICNNIMIDIETALMKAPTRFDDKVGYRLDSQGNRIRKTSEYAYSEASIVSAMKDICSSWREITGTVKASDGRLTMIKTTKMQGSFSGSLNLGGEASKKVNTMCDEIMNDNEDKFIEVIKENNAQDLKEFCKNHIDNECINVNFPKDVLNHIQKTATNDKTNESNNDNNNDNTNEVNKDDTPKDKKKQK